MEQLRLDTIIFEGTSNAFVCFDQPSETLTLIDTGVSHPTTRSQLSEQLATLGHTIDAIDNVILTHFHYDHAGLAGEIQQQSDAQVYCHHREAPILRLNEESLGHEYERYRKRLGLWGLSETEQDAIITLLQESVPLAGIPIECTPVNDGETLDIGHTPITIRHLPGHTLGHIVVQTTGNEVFGGDVILPTKTPNIGGDLRATDPLTSYFESLEQLVTMDPVTLYPGHGASITNVPVRIAELCDHHHRRFERVLDELKAGSSTPRDIAAGLFGDLTGIHLLHGTAEVAAHLDHLVEIGSCRVEGGHYTIHTNIPASDRFPSTLASLLSERYE